MLNCKAVQETYSASSLNTNDCFVLVDSSLAFVWYGKVERGDSLVMELTVIITGVHW